MKRAVWLYVAALLFFAASVVIDAVGGSWGWVVVGVVGVVSSAFLLAREWGQRKPRAPAPFVERERHLW